MKKVTQAYLTSPSITFIIIVNNPSEDYYVTIIKGQDNYWRISGSEGLENKVINWDFIRNEIQQKTDTEIEEILKKLQFK